MNDILWKLCILLLLLFAVAGCQTMTNVSDLETEIYRNGYISVEAPEIWTQERLLSFRNEEAEWLKEQLSEEKMLEVTQGFQAQRESRLQFVKRLLSGYQNDEEWKPVRKAEIQNRVAELQRQQEQSNLQHQIKMQQLQQSLKAETQTDTLTSTANTTATSTIAQQSRSTNQWDNSDSEDMLSGVPGLTRSNATSVEKFRDLLAYRDAVNSARQENLLDDVSDKFGNTVYLLKFDVSILPGEITEKDSFAEVTLGLNPETIPWQKFHSMLVQAINKKIPDEIVSLTKRFKETLRYPNSDVLTQEERFDLYREIEDTKQKFLQEMQNNSPQQNNSTANKEDNTKRFQKLLLPIEDANVMLADTTTLAELEEDILRVAIKNYVANKYQRILSKYMKFRLQEVNDMRQEIFYRIYAYDMTKDESAYTESEMLNIQSEIEELFREMKKSCRVYTYAVTPKEYVQNISDVATKENLLDMLFEISTILSDGTKVDDFAKYIRRGQEFFNTVLRRPLVVGFSKGPQTFGWLFGPRFSIEHGADLQVEFKHKPEYHTVRAFIVVPSFYENLTLYVQKNWICYTQEPEWPPIISWFGTQSQVYRLYDFQTQLQLNHEYQKMREMPSNEWTNWRQQEIEGILPLSKVIIKLPANSEAALEYVMEVHGASHREPVILNVTPDAVIANQESVSLIIEGRNLWRNTRVFLGTTSADKIESLPDLRGLVATFHNLPYQNIESGNHYTLPLVVSTAYGTRKYNIVVHNSYQLSSQTLHFSYLRNYIIHQQDKLELYIDKGSIPDGSKLTLCLWPNTVSETNNVQYNCKITGAQKNILVTTDVINIKNPDKLWQIDKSTFPLELCGMIQIEGTYTTSIPIESHIILYEKDEEKATISPQTITPANLQDLTITLPKKIAKAYPDFMQAYNSNLLRVQLLGQTFHLTGTTESLKLSSNENGIVGMATLLQRLRLPTEITLTLVGESTALNLIIQPNLRIINP